MSVVEETSNKSAKINKNKRRSAYMTTTELAKLCGVSRFTIINWTKQGRIKAAQTVGRHYRIPVSEAMSFLKTFHNREKSVASESTGHCWEYPQKTNCEKECRNCLIYRREVDYCFEVVRQFGKGLIRCKGDCLNCDYFEDVFSFYRKRTQKEEPSDQKSIKKTKEKKNLLYNVAYGVGRGVHVLKGKE